MTSDLARLARQRLADLDRAKARRHLRPHRPGDKGAPLDLAGNDYLGLARHPALIAGAVAWTEKWGAGAAASRLITGTIEDYLAVEAKLAAFKRAEAALVFPSGFQANLALLPAIVDLLESAGEEVEIFADRLNHASLHMAIAAAGKTQHRYRHNDLDHLADHLGRNRADRKRPLIVTESVFSMDGDRADLDGLIAIAERHHAILYVDEAHATGILGPEGRGLAAAYPGRIDIVMGTLGKAMGAAGAYVAGSRDLIDYLVNRAAGFVYSTAPMPALFGALEAALAIVPQMTAERARIADLSARLRLHLARLGFKTGGDTQIVPAILGDNAECLAAQAHLESQGFRVAAIRPPSVPPHSARLRFSLSANITPSDIDRLRGALADLAAGLPR